MFPLQARFVPSLLPCLRHVLPSVRANAAHMCTDSVAPSALYDFHVSAGGKIVNFAGYALPVQYADQSISASHLHTRRHASIFDVSHMLQTYLHGKDAASCLETLCTADIHGLAAGSGTLSVFTNAQGGILDDLIVSKISDNLLYVVSNAAMKQQDSQLMEHAVAAARAAGKDVSIEFMPASEQSLIAVQGPIAVQTLAKLLPNARLMEQLYFMQTTTSEIAGVPNCRITRCGYTGEDGVELSVPSAHVQHVTEALLAADAHMKMAGLGARDSLRLEAGLCLYGADIDGQTTPVEAALAWLVAKRRRAELNFPGARQIVAQLQQGVKRRRVGFVMQGTQVPPARAGVHLSLHGEHVGQVTSGCPSPSLGRNIAMGYVSEQLKKPGTVLDMKIRNKLYPAVVTAMPFVQTHYYTKPKTEKAK